MSKVSMPCIPHMGLYQKDLVFWNTLSKRSGATIEDKKQCAEVGEEEGGERGDGGREGDREGEGEKGVRNDCSLDHVALSPL